MRDNFCIPSNISGLANWIGNAWPLTAILSLHVRIKPKTEYPTNGRLVFVFFGMLNFCFKKLGYERETRDNRLVAGRGHRVQGELCGSGFVCCK